MSINDSGRGVAPQQANPQYRKQETMQGDMKNAELW